MTVNRLSPKPIIASVVQTWDVTPGMKYALVEDVERRVWIVQSCPAGTQCWTVAQASELPQTGRTGQAVRAAVGAGRTLEQSISQAVPAMTARASVPLPRRQSTRRTEDLIPSARPLRRVTRRDSKGTVCA